MLLSIAFAGKRLDIILSNIYNNNENVCGGVDLRSFIAIKPGTAKDSFLTENNRKLLSSFGQVTDPGESLTDGSFIRMIGDAEVYFTCWGSPRLGGEVLEAAPKVRLLTHLCGTVVPFVSDEMWDRGIRVVSGNDFFAESVAEGTIGYIMSALRDIPGYSRRLKENKEWKGSDAYSEGMLGRTIGIVSYGAVARHLVRMLQPFRMKIMVYDIVPLPEEDKEKYGLEQATLPEIFSSCDIISVHTPLNPATHRLIGRELFSLIKPGSLFVNTSRGKVIDQEALEDALEAGRFRAVLDVYEKEPPLPDCRLYTLPNVLMMPHMAGPTVDLRKYIAERLITESAGFIDGGGPLPHEITRAKAVQMSAK